MNAANNDPLANALDQVAASSGANAASHIRSYATAFESLTGYSDVLHSIYRNGAVIELTVGDLYSLLAGFTSTQQTILDLQEKLRALTLENEGAKRLAKQPCGHCEQTQAENARLRGAAQKVIDMNRQQAVHQYGDAEKAEQWACVRVLRAALAPDLKEGI